MELEKSIFFHFRFGRLVSFSHSKTISCTDWHILFEKPFIRNECVFYTRSHQNDDLKIMNQTILLPEMVWLKLSLSSKTRIIDSKLWLVGKIFDVNDFEIERFIDDDTRWARARACTLVVTNFIANCRFTDSFLMILFVQFISHRNESLVRSQIFR